MNNKLTVYLSAPVTMLSGLTLLVFDLSEKDQLRFVLTWAFTISLLICSTAFVRWSKHNENKTQNDTKQD